MRILLFSGSLRSGSLNKKLLNVIKSQLDQMPGVQTQVADLKLFNIPVYDGDIETAGMPEGVKAFGEMITNCDALISCSPEYNSSIAGSLKNAIDWVSRLRPVPFAQKPVLLTGASPGGFGAVRALGQTRAPFEALGAYVYPQSFGLAKAHEAFTAEGELVDAGQAKRVQELLNGFTGFAKKLV